LRQGKLDDATRTYRKAIDLTPGNFSAHNGLGVAFMRTGRLLDARAEFIAAIDLNASFMPARDNLRAVLIELWKGHLDELPRFRPSLKPKG
jgi:Flp pilus assembly protein TadD